MAAKLDLTVASNRDKFLSALERRNASWKSDFHKVLCHILKGWKTSGDHETFLRQMNKAFGVADYARQAMVEWSIQFVPGIGFDKDTFSLSDDKEIRKEIRDAVDVDAAFKKPYWEVKPAPKTVTVFDINAEILKLLKKRAERSKAQTNGTKGATEEDVLVPSATVVEALRKLLPVTETVEA